MEYFADVIEEDDFYAEVQLNLEEENYDPSSVVLSQGEECKSIFFIVQGKIELTT